MSNKVINKYQDFLNQKDLLNRGWTKKEIDSTLIKPDFIMSYRAARFDYTCYLYDLETVARMERTNHMDLGDNLVNKRDDYVFREDLYEQGWTEKQLNTLLPPPKLIRNWAGGSAQATYKVWERNTIAHELAFAVSQDEKNKALARRKKMAETKQAKLTKADTNSQAKTATTVPQTKTKLPQQLDSSLKKALADNIPENIFKFVSNSNRVAVAFEKHRQVIIDAAKKLGFPTNYESKKFKQHWVFATEEARELFVMEVIDFLAIAYGLVDVEQEAMDDVLDQVTVIPGTEAKDELLQAI